MLPHCQEAQSQVPSLAGAEYPLYLVLTAGGYLLVLFVERVLFSVHDSAHGGHGGHAHTGIARGGEPAAAAPAPAAAAEGGEGDEDGGGSGAEEEEDGGAGGGGGSAAGGVASPAQLRKPLLAPPGAGAGGSGSGSGAHAHSTECGHGHGHGAGAGAAAADLRQGMVLLLAMSVHTFLECMALGLMVRARRPAGRRADCHFRRRRQLPAYAPGRAVLPGGQIGLCPSPSAPARRAPLPPPRPAGRPARVFRAAGGDRQPQAHQRAGGAPFV
jgi:hypothetical protein